MFKNEAVDHEVYVKDDVELQDGGILQYCYEVTGSSHDAIFTIVWNDPVASPRGMCAYIYIYIYIYINVCMLVCVHALKVL